MFRVRWPNVAPALRTAIAIDDFGKGHTAWTHVFLVSIFGLQIDGSWVEQIADSKKSEEVVRNLCRTGVELGVVSASGSSVAATRVTTG